METGEECIEALSRLARDERISTAEVSGIGAFESATLGFYQLKKQEYQRIPVIKHTEVLSLLGNLTVTDEGPRVHVHASLSYMDGSTIGGHLFEGRAGATLEVFVREEPGEVRRAEDAGTGLALMDL